MSAHDKSLTSNLAMLGGRLDDTELELRVTRFQDALRWLRDDPDEAARIDAIVKDAEAEKGGSATSVPGGIQVNGGEVTFHITVEQPGDPARLEQLATVGRELADYQREMLDLTALLEDRSGEWKPQPRRLWGWLPAFGILVGILAAATTAVAIHAAPVTASFISILLAGSTTVTALLSLVMTWTSVRVLNRRGGADKALELMVGVARRDTLRMAGGSRGVGSRLTIDNGELATMSEHPSEDVERFLTVAEVATLMRVSKPTVYRLIHSGELEAIPVGRSFRVPERAMNSYLRGLGKEARSESV